MYNKVKKDKIFVFQTQKNIFVTKLLIIMDNITKHSSKEATIACLSDVFCINKTTAD